MCIGLKDSILFSVPSKFFEIIMLDIILESLFWWSAIETELEIEQEDLDEEC